MDKTQNIVMWCVLITTIGADINDIFRPHWFFQNWWQFGFWNFMVILIIIMWISERKEKK